MRVQLMQFRRLFTTLSSKALLCAFLFGAPTAQAAVAIDALSVGVTNPGPNNHMGSWGAGFTGGVPFSGFISPSASATLAIVFIGADTTTPGTWTITLGGTAMTQVGTQVNLGSFSLSFFALLNPSSGSLTLNIGGSGLTSNTIVYGGVTFTGTDTSSLANAVTVTTNTGTSTTASATTGSPTSTCMAVAGFGGSTATVSSTDGTNIDTRSGFSSSGFGMSYYTGTGTAITGNGTLSASAAWGAEIALAKPTGGCTSGGGGGGGGS